ncbi:MAG: DUF2911 domain-containing protein [Gemmatimonadota bacterium]|nr:MAG: DUF2911 domain-containing protein [Gemmatimonadota bacterium]
MSVLSTASLLTVTLVSGAVMLGDAAAVKLDCIVMRQNLDSRPSPLDSVSFEVQGNPVKLCYGRPSAKGRTMIGGEAAPYGKLWRTGANEPTMIHTSTALNLAGIEIEPGSYSFYTLPGESEWQIVLNRSTSQWGHEGRYSDEIKAQEVGRGAAKSESIDAYVETFTMRTEAVGEDVMLLLEWEHTRVRVPISGR